MLVQIFGPVSGCKENLNSAIQFKTAEMSKKFSDDELHKSVKY